MTQPRSNFQAGFTLIELVLVLAISVILAAIAAPRYSASLSRYRADGAARRLAADLVLAQATAKATSASCTVAFFNQPNGYQIQGLTAPDGGGGAYIVVLSAEPYRASIKGVNFTDSVADNTLKFSGYGEPDSGATIIITVGGVDRTVTVSASSGTVSIQ